MQGLAVTGPAPRGACGFDLRPCSSAHRTPALRCKLVHAGSDALEQSVGLGRLDGEDRADRRARRLPLPFTRTAQLPAAFTAASGAERRPMGFSGGLLHSAWTGRSLAPGAIQPAEVLVMPAKRLLLLVGLLAVAGVLAAGVAWA